MIVAFGLLILRYKILSRLKLASVLRFLVKSYCSSKVKLEKGIMHSDAPKQLKRDHLKNMKMLDREIQNNEFNS